MISKYLDFPDVEVTRPDLKWQPAGDMMTNGPKMHDYLKEMNEKVISSKCWPIIYQCIRD
jgi:oligo-1,6-glucosidase